MSEEERMVIVKDSFTYVLFELRIAIYDLVGILFGEPAIITEHKDTIKREMDDYISELLAS